jgi:hypothetical protein
MSCQFRDGMVCPDLRVAGIGVITCKGGREISEGRGDIGDVDRKPGRHWIGNEKGASSEGWHEQWVKVPPG